VGLNLGGFPNRRRTRPSYKKELRGKVRKEGTVLSKDVVFFPNACPMNNRFLAMFLI
jgi:hypothetical protein